MSVGARRREGSKEEGRKGGREGGREGGRTPYLVKECAQASPIAGHAVDFNPLPHRVSLGQGGQDLLYVGLGQDGGGFREGGEGPEACERVEMAGVVAGGREREEGRGGGVAVDGWKEREGGRKGGKEGEGRYMSVGQGVWGA